MKMILYSIALFSLIAVSQANTYYGFRREDPNNAIPIPSNVSSFDFSVPIDSWHSTIVLIHEHNGDVNSNSNQMMTIEILANSYANVIVVDWSLYAKMRYSDAVNHVPTAARLLASFLTRLESQHRIRFYNLHLVGFGLGAHVAGNTGRELLRLTGQSVARITGLDPVGSQWGSRSARLRSTDATYVEVIHTDGDGPLANGIGTAIGDVDFYVNGGSNQPGCFSHSCSHTRAYELFAGTFVRPSPLYGNFCNTNLQLSMNRCTSQPLHVGGNDLNKVRVNGVYRVNTGRNYPY